MAGLVVSIVTALAAVGIVVCFVLMSRTLSDPARKAVWDRAEKRMDRIIEKLEAHKDELQ